MQKPTTPVGEDFEIKPEMIDATKPFEVFDIVYIGMAARIVIEFCQLRNSWHSFSLEEYVNYLQVNYPKSKDKGSEEFPEPIVLSCLIGTGNFWIIKKDGQYHLTEELIRRCYESSPR